MSIFAKNFRTIKTDITGNNLELKLNVAVWFILDTEFGITQGSWANDYAKSPNLTSAKFLTAVLKANKHNVTLEEVTENVTEGELEKFINAYYELNINDYKDQMGIEDVKDEVDESISEEGK